MSGIGFLRMKKLTGISIILTAARHNARAIQAELRAGGTIDPLRSSSNYRLAGPGTPEEVATVARNRMALAGVTKLRKDAVRGVELVFSLPVDSGIDDRPYFESCLGWTADRFGGNENILGAEVHLDEAAPHCHVLVLPLIGGRMVGSDLMGGPSKLKGHVLSFHEAVASRYGLRRAPKRLSGASKAGAAASVLQHMRQRDDPALRSQAWDVIRAAIESDPAPWLLAFNVPLGQTRTRPKRSMTDIFISTGKGPKREPTMSNHIGFASPQSSGRREKAGGRRAVSASSSASDEIELVSSLDRDGDSATSNPIGFASDSDARTLSCVGFDRNEPPDHRLDAASSKQQSTAGCAPDMDATDAIQTDEQSEVGISASDCIGGSINLGQAARHRRDAPPVELPVDDVFGLMSVTADRIDELSRDCNPPLRGASAGPLVTTLVNSETCRASPMLETGEEGVVRRPDVQAVTEPITVSIPVSIKPGATTFEPDTQGQSHSGLVNGLYESCSGSVRVREGDRSAATWDETLGEFIEPPAPSRRSKDKAQSWVAGKLAAKSLAARR